GGLDIKKIDQISENLLAAVFFLTVLAGLFSWVLTLFLPEQYSPISYLLPICLLGPFFYTLSETTAIGITLSRRTIYSMLASVGAMLVNALGNYLFVPKWGALGAASSTAIAFVIFYALRTEFSCLVWRQIPRKKQYNTILVLTAIAITFGFVAVQYEFTPALWAILLLLGTKHFRNQLIIFWKYINNQININGLGSGK
ncbi:MAG TPA: polysaccharide biosynthesis C-terminal domain-containing protein, partial [Tissierellaceae bacterium]|nr:polysaccharide biosynthesis C-terminal domain-containing protein [Tissierellaceae bacterium]